jgi:anti-sigma factor RsiW
MRCPITVSIGAYVLGAVDPAERAQIKEHLTRCDVCREEFISLAPLPGLLRHVPAVDAARLGAYHPPRARQRGTATRRVPR